MSGVITQGIDILVQNGLVEILIFALIFAIVFGILQSIEMFSNAGEKEAKKYNTLISLVFGLLAIIPHYVRPYSNFDIVPMIERVLPQIALVALGILCLLILAGMFGLHGYRGKDEQFNPIIAGVILIIVIYIFVGAVNRGGRIHLPYWFGPDVIAASVAIGIFALIMWFIMRGGDEA